MTLPPESWDRIDALLAARTDNFLELVALARLDRKRAFRHADLRGSDLRGADLRDFNFTAALFDGADLRGADLSRTLGVTLGMVETAIFDETTVWPAAMAAAMRAPFRPFPWADAWGTDEHGRWVSFSVLAADGTQVTQRMRWIPPGRFMRGSPETEAGRYEDEGPCREVTIADGFWLFDTACTEALSEAEKAGR